MWPWNREKPISLHFWVSVTSNMPGDTMMMKNSSLGTNTWQRIGKLRLHLSLITDPCEALWIVFPRKTIGSMRKCLHKEKRSSDYISTRGLLRTGKHSRTMYIKLARMHWTSSMSTSSTCMNFKATRKASRDSWWVLSNKYLQRKRNHHNYQQDSELQDQQEQPWAG